MMEDHAQSSTAIISGGTTGIGLHLSIGLAQSGLKVVMLGRREDHARQALERVKSEAPQARVEFLLGDLSDLEEVERVGRTLRSNHPVIELLINNVGAFYLRRQVSEQGIEKTFAVNHLSHFYLTHFLLDNLRAGPDARIIETSSGAHHTPSSRDLDWQMRRGYSGWGAYGQSKLANILFARELSRRFGGPDLTIVSYHPGFVRTQLATRNALIRPFMKLAYLFLGGSAQEGADTGLYLALDPQVQGASGGYYVDRRQVRASQLARDSGLAKELWELSLDLTGVNEFGVVDR